MLSGRSTQRTTAPAAPLMDYNTGQLDAATLARLFGLAALGLLLGAFPGSALALLCRPSAYEAWGAWSVLGFALGTSWAFGGAALATWSLGEWHAERRAFRQRQREAFELELELREAQGGVIIEEHSNEWELRADKPDEVLWFLVAMHRAAQEGREAPWALRRVCDEGVWVGNRKIAINTNQARLMVDNLATMGLITGRTERHPGQWVPATLDDAVSLYERNSKKVL
jgi:hypothetical protein